MAATSRRDALCLLPIPDRGVRSQAGIPDPPADGARAPTSLRRPSGVNAVQQLGGIRAQHTSLRDHHGQGG